MTIHLQLPQVVWVTLTLLSLGGGMAVKHGQLRTGRYSFWWHLAGSLLLSWLLWCGGFFHPAAAAGIPAAAQSCRSELVRNARVVWGLDAPVADLAAQVHQESGWRADALSAAGAQGLAQMMPGTARWLAQSDSSLAPAAPWNVSWSLRALVRYDRWLWGRVSARDGCERMAMVLSAYNGGLRWLLRDIALARDQSIPADIWFRGVERVNSGRSASAWQENRRYPTRILTLLSVRYAAWGERSCDG